MTYAEWYCADDRFQGLVKGDRFNSHVPVLEMYRRQLVEWNKSAAPQSLTAADVKRITDAAIHPSNRT